MRRFTILGLMRLVLGIAVAIAALRNADDYWAGGLLLTTSILIGVTALGACCDSGRQRAARLGFAVFAGGYLAVADLGGSASHLAQLLTTWLLVYIHQRVVPPQMYTFTVTTTAPSPTFPNTVVLSNVALNSGVNTVTNVTSTVGMATAVNADGSARWKSLLPGAANYEAFSVVGHCLFAVMAGLAGAVIARRYQSRRQRELEAATVTTT